MTTNTPTPTNPAKISTKKKILIKIYTILFLFTI